MKTAKQVIHREFVKGVAGKDMYGVFTENLQTAEGRLRGYDSDEKINGFNKDGVEYMKSFNPGNLRYPGGNYVSSYHWKDGIGPVENRPTRINYAFSGPGRVVLDQNTFGLDEFTEYAKTCGMDGMYTVNLGTTGTVDEAVSVMEYCNYPGGTELSDMRRANGHEEPYNIKYWCLGNEMDGHWQIGQQTPESYGHKAREVAKMMKMITPDSKLIICGSTNHTMENFPEWDRIALEYAMPYIDWVSIHHLFSYSENLQLGGDGDPVITIDDIPFMPEDISRHIEQEQAVIEFVKAKKNYQYDVKIVMDEFAFPGGGAVVPKDLNWTEVTQPTAEGFLNMEEADAFYKPFIASIWCMPFLTALLTGGLYIAALNHCDVLAGTNHGFDPIRTKDGSFTPADAYPFLHVSTYGRGKVLESNLESPTVKTAHYGDAPSLQTATVYDEENGMLTVFAANMNLREDIAYEYVIEGFQNVEPIELIRMYDDQPLAANTPAQPNRIKPVTLPASEINSGMTLPKHSWNVLRFSVK